MSYRDISLIVVVLFAIFGWYAAAIITLAFMLWQNSRNSRHIIP